MTRALLVLSLACGGSDAPPPVVVAVHPCPELPAVTWPCTVRLQGGPDSLVYWSGLANDPRYVHRPFPHTVETFARVLDSAGQPVYVRADTTGAPWVRYGAP